MNNGIFDSGVYLVELDAIESTGSAQLVKSFCHNLADTLILNYEKAFRKFNQEGIQG